MKHIFLLASLLTLSSLALAQGPFSLAITTEKAEFGGWPSL